MERLDSAYWESRYLQGITGWDLKEVSLPLKAYFDQLDNKDLKILIPGCGYAYEAYYLHTLGFDQITVVDFSESAIAKARILLSDTKVNVLCEDFFAHTGTYDLIIEQTMFCAIDPSLREDYVKKMDDLLNLGGTYTGILFNVEFEQEGPPFGGSIEIYRPLFLQHFDISILEPCYNSILPRKGREAWFKVKKIKSHG